MAITDNQKREMVKHNEGYRDSLYYDTLGNLTGGYGHYFSIGSFLPDKAIDALFDHDFWNAKKDVQSLKRLCGIGDIGSVRETVLIDMLFNMGLAKVLKFRKMLLALHLSDYVKASNEIINSLYYDQHEEAGLGKWHRAKRNAWMMQEGVLWLSEKHG